MDYIFNMLLFFVIVEGSQLFLTGKELKRFFTNSPFNCHRHNFSKHEGE